MEKQNQKQQQHQDNELWVAFGGEEIAEMHPYGFVYISEGVWVDRYGNYHEY